jgi:hypothetical protein
VRDLVFANHPHHPFRFVLENQSRKEDEITADIHQPATADRSDVANVPRIRIVVAELAHHRTHLTDSAGVDQFTDFDPLGVRLDHECFFDFHAGPIAHAQQLTRLFGIECDRLFTQNVFARFSGFDGPRHVQMIRQRIVYGLDLFVGQHFLVRTIGLRNAKFVGESPGFFQISRGERDDSG